MIAALATFAFLAAGWIAVVALASTFEDYGTWIRSALAGQPMIAVPAVSVRISPRRQARHPEWSVPCPALRAAA